MHETTHNCIVHFHCIHIYRLLSARHSIIIIIITTHSHSFAFLPLRVTQTHKTHAYEIPAEVCMLAQNPFSKCLHILT